MSETLMVTGASRGIGLATVRQFFFDDNGVSDIVMVARDSDDFDKAVAELQAENHHGKTIHQLTCDMGDRHAVLDVAEEAYQLAGSIDLLVNNAGYTAPAPIHEIVWADFERTIAVNLYAPFGMVQHLLHLGNTFRFVLNVASTAGITGRAGWLTYSASKAAVIAMSTVMKEELAIYGTRVACISPGRCATALRRQLAPDEDPSTIMQPEDVAEVVKMLASDSGRLVDSQNLVVRL
jgi:3-oxoacyl-[acyl-carrier protein] reductase